MTRLSRTLLIVDDSPEDRDLFRRYLLCDPEYDYIIFDAELGQQGLDLWQQQQPDAILLDYRLPDLDGLEFLSRLQPYIQAFHLPVIVTTGQGNEAIAVQAIKAGAQDYLIKGYLTPEALQRAVNGAINTAQLRIQLHQRIERERLILQIVQKIQQTMDLQEILQTTVTEVRQFLHTDRVVVFQLQPDGYGTVMAESVGAEWRSLLSEKIYDPCLATDYARLSRPESLADADISTDYVQRYRRGEVTAIADIHSGHINPCHAELLAQFQVQANLVVPILLGDRFWGLLIAHHCVTSRSWHPLEIDLLKELVAPMGIALRQAELYQQVQQELVERKQTATDLRDSEARYVALAQVSPVGIFRTDVDGDCQYVNPRWCDLAGLSPEEAQGKGWVKAIHSDDRDRVMTEWRQAQILNVPFQAEYRFQTPGGAVFWLVGQALAEQDAEGNVLGYVGTITDISDRKQTEEDLHNNEQKLRLALAGAKAGSWDWNILTNKVTWSPENYILYGVNSVNDANWYQIWYNRLHPDDRERVRLEILRVIGQRQVEFQLEFRIVHPERGIRWLLGLGRLILNEQKVPMRLSGINIDITDRRQMEETLRQSEEFKDRLLASSPDCIQVLDIDGRLLYMNAGGMCLLEMDDFAAYHQSDWLCLWTEEYRPAAQQALATAKMGETSVFQGVYPTAKGTPKWWEVMVSPIRDAVGQTEQLLSVSRDITDRKQAEAERDRLLAQEQFARTEAERANRVKDEFLAILSHELRSPLNPILGWTKLLQTRKFDETRTAEALATIERNAKLQTQLIDDLLDVAKILRGKLVIETAPVDLVFVIESAIDTVRAAAVAKSIPIHPVFSPVGPVLGDSARLQQVVWNLLSNAIKFTPKNGRVDIRLECVGNEAQIAVQDTGKGIRPDFLPHLFESFHQEDASITRKYGGLGLGLAIVRSLVEAHGGTIRADSPGEGQGATFTVTLPLLESDLALMPVNASPALNLDLTGLRVLAADDEPDARELLSMVLTLYGADVLVVPSATALLTALDSFQPDIVISDIGMPGTDGYTLIQQIRARPPAQGGQVPAIALTAYAREEDEQRAIASGFQRQVTKPLEPEQLVQTIMAIAPPTR